MAENMSENLSALMALWSGSSALMLWFALFAKRSGMLPRNNSYGVAATWILGWPVLAPLWLLVASYREIVRIIY